MARYAAPQHTPHKRRVLSRGTQILSVTVFLLFISMCIIARSAVRAAPANNPIFATIQDVQNAISAAVSPIQSAIANLQTQQANQATQISNLQNSSSKSLKVYDANGHELGSLVGHD